MRLQHYKCAYCERRLEDADVGKVEWDLEHFRPKASVKEIVHNEINFPTGPARDEGYYLLAYHPFNYLASCKPCNTPLKSTYFPIGGTRGPADARQPKLLADEKPLFIFPLGPTDVSPGSLITYMGMLAVPKHKRGFKHHRAKVTILCFDLNRETLLLQRAEQLDHMWMAYLVSKGGTATKDVKQAEKTLTRLRSARSIHAGCSRAFYRLIKRDPAEAVRVYDTVFGFLNRRS